jgi:hypothetical protein
VTRVLGLFFLLCCACASVPYRVRGDYNRNARLDHSSCEVVSGKQKVTVRATDKPGFLEIGLGTWMSANAVAPYPLPENPYRGPADVEYNDVYPHHGAYPSTALWQQRDAQLCVTFLAELSEHHLPESAPMGLNGGLQLTTHSSLEIGPWCTDSCK